MPARAWQAGAGPGEAPFTIDLDSTICETYGLAKEGARHHGYTGARGYHPLLAIAAGTGDVLLAGCARAAPTPLGVLRRRRHRPSGLGERMVATKTLSRWFFSLPGRLSRSARRLTLHLPRRWPWETQFSLALARLQAIPFAP